jgi:Putative DNA-binding domain
VTLQELQRQFLNAMYQASPATVESGLVEQFKTEHLLSPEQQLAVYQGSVQGNLTEALGEIYPRVKQSVGATFFAALAARYVRAHPSCSHSLDNYGASFAEYCSSFSALENLPYCSDLARVDWAWHTAFHAQDAPTLQSDVLLALSEAQLSEKVMCLHPSVRVVESEFPIYQIWQLCEREYRTESNKRQAQFQLEKNAVNNEASVSLDDGAESVLVWRRGLQTQVALISRLELRFLREIAEQKTLAEVFEELLVHDEQGALTQSFARLLGFEVFCTSSE